MRLLALFLLLVLPRAAPAAEHDLSVPTAQGPIVAKIYAAPGTAARPAVLFVHGRGGNIADPFYRRYIRDLNAAGLDAWLFSYYTAEDRAVMEAPDRAARVARLWARIGAWSKTIDEVAAVALVQPLSSHKAGLVGFSNGGFIAVGAAGLDPSIGALVVFYSGFPDPLAEQIKRLPPLLELHGDADRIIPLDYGSELVDRAKALGGAAEQVVYPGADHGFDDLDTDAAHDARRRAVKFLADQLR